MVGAILESIVQNPDIREGMSREEIDAAIAHRADTETLFDRPYEEDRKTVRVSGALTVESLSPTASCAPGRRTRGPSPRRRRPTRASS